MFTFRARWSSWGWRSNGRRFPVQISSITCKSVWVCICTYMHVNCIFSDGHTCACYKWTFEYIMEHALISGVWSARRKNMRSLQISSARYSSSYILVLIAVHYSQMQNMINHTYLEDTSHHKSHMGSYAVPVPDKALINPPISDDGKSCSKMGFNHPQLGPMLCPAKFLIKYNKNPAEFFFCDLVVLILLQVKEKNPSWVAEGDCSIVAHLPVSREQSRWRLWP